MKLGRMSSHWSRRRRKKLCEVEAGTAPGPEAWERLHTSVVETVSWETARQVRLFSCDRDEDGTFARFAGLDSARTALLVAEQHSTSRPAVLVLGLLQPPEVGGGSIRERAGAALLQWPGARYLRYGFSREQLLDAANSAIQGAKEPLPSEVLASGGDVRRHMSKIRHWLENRLRNGDGARNALEAELCGGMTLHESHLEPVAAVSDAHRGMVERLWMLERPAVQMAPGVGGLAVVRGAMDEFERRWGKLEEFRAALRGAPSGERRKRLAAMREQQDKVREALSAAIGALDDLDGELDAGRQA